VDHRIEATIAEKQAEYDAAEQDLGRDTFGSQMTAKLHRVGRIQRELAELDAKRQLISPRYQIFRSLSDPSLRLTLRDGEFAELPGHVRHQGPWQAVSRGEVTHLKPEHRSAIEGDGFLVERGEFSSSS
jgi:hypothetical protein